MKLILLPGMDGTGRLFDRLLAALPPDVSPTVISYETASTQDYDALTAFVLARLPAREPFVLLGESFSGPIAVRAGASIANCVGVILAASFVRCPIRVPPWAIHLTIPLQYLRAPNTAARLFLLNGHSDATLSDELSATLSRVPAAVLAKRLNSIISVDARDALTQLCVPVLDIRAERDRLVGSRATEDISRYADDVTLLEIDSPHMVLQTHPAECAREIAKFLAKVSLK